MNKRLFHVIYIVIIILLLFRNSYKNKDFTETDLENFFRNITIENNHAVAIKVNFTYPGNGTAYVGTIHGYPDNLSVCEELISPYNEDPDLSATPGNTYFCEILKSKN